MTEETTPLPDSVDDIIPHLLDNDIKNNLTDDGKFVKMLNGQNEIKEVPNDKSVINDAISKGQYKFVAPARPRGIDAVNDIANDENSLDPINPFRKTSLKKIAPYNVITKDNYYKMKNAAGEDKDIPYSKDTTAINTALVNGYTFRDPEAQDHFEGYIRRIREQADDNIVGDKSDDALGQGLLNGLSSIPHLLVGTKKHLDVPDNFTNKDDPNADYLYKTLDTNDILRTIALNQVNKRLHPIANFVGNAIGEGLPLAAGPIAEGIGAAGEGVQALVEGSGLAPGLLRTGLGIAAKGGLEGVLITSPETITKLAIDKDPQGAIESLSMGAGLGIGFGLLGAGVKSIFAKGASEPLLSPITNALEKEGMSTESAEIKAALPSPETQQQFAETLTKKLGKNPTQEQISSVMQKLSSGEDMDSIIKKISSYADDIDASKISSKIAEIEEDVPKLSNFKAFESGGAKEVISEASKKLEALSSKDGTISLENLHKFAQELGPFTPVSNNIESEVKSLIHQEAMGEISSAGDIAAGKAGPKLASEWAAEKGNAEVAKLIHTKLAPILENSKVASSNKLVSVVKSILKFGVEHSFVGKSLVKGVEIISKGRKLVNAVTNNPELEPVTKSFLTKNAEHTSIGSFLTLDTMHTRAKNIDNVVPFIRNFSEKGAEIKFSKHHDPIKQALGDSANGLSTMQQYNKLKDASANMSNPEVAKAHVDSVVDPLTKDHPEFAQGVAEALHAKIAMIQSLLPKSTTNMNPFAPKPNDDPSSAQLAELKSHLAVVQNPFILLDNMKKNTITAKQVDIAQQLTPNTLDAIRGKVMEASLKGDVKMDYQQRIALSTLMGQPMDSSLGKVQALQAPYTPPQGAPPGPPPAPKKSKGGHGKNLEKSPLSKPTTAQRISNM